VVIANNKVSSAILMLVIRGSASVEALETNGALYPPAVFAPIPLGAGISVWR